MPSKSKKQARFMAAAAHDPKFAKKAGVDQKVAQDFSTADSWADRLASDYTDTVQRIKAKKRR